MKKIYSFISFLFPFLGMMLLLCGCSSRPRLIVDGKTGYRIFVSANASQSEKYAASELQKYLHQTTGCKLEISHAIRPEGKQIYVGFREAPESLVSGLKTGEFGKEEYIIRSDGQNLLIAGGEPRGTLYGVIGYLFDYLGCRWYTHDVVKVPAHKVVYLPEKEDRQQPAFEYREAWYNEAYEPDWAVHNRINPANIPDSLGGAYVTYPFVHTFYQLVPPEIHFKRHPEYFSMVNGKRVGEEAQLCLTNPDVVKVATETVFDWIKKHPEASMFSVDQNDGYGYCECPACKALDDAEGSHSGTLLHFVNQVADAVAKVYPEVKLQTLAYAYTEKAPKTLRPADNVTIRLCHYEYCSAHPLSGCDNHKPFIHNLNEWNKISKRLSVWDYFTDYNRYLMPFPNFETMKHNVKFYADHGVKGLFIQGSNMPSRGGSEFSTLRAWVFSQLMWNPHTDPQVLVDEFVTEVYGNASGYISEYISLLHDQVKPDSVFFSIWALPENMNFLGPATIHKADSLFDLAFKAAGNDAALFKRVELAYLPILYTKLYFYSIGGTAHLTQEQKPKAMADFKRIIAENQITRMAEGIKIGSIDDFIDACELLQTFYTDWWLIGPFDNENLKGLVTTYEPEVKFDTTHVYTGKNNAKIKWQRYNNNVSGYIDFAKMYQPNEYVVAYARRDLVLDQDEVIKLGIGSNDGIRIWVDGKLVLDRQVSRTARVNDDIVTLNLKKGVHSLLVKVDQTGLGWGFYCAKMR